MSQISVCILTFNSLRTIDKCLTPASEVADEIIVLDSGSTDGTIEYLVAKGITPRQIPYVTHAQQMNTAISLAAHDWVLCLDSDEFLDSETISNISSLKSTLRDPALAYRISRYWKVLGQDVHAIYPVSSPDFPVRLFNRTVVRFNDQPVDDKPTGFSHTQIIMGRVTHDTFFSLDELFAKANSYTSRLVRHKTIRPSLMHALFSPLAAFLKWYFRKGAYRDGKIGGVTAAYAALYTFLKYFKAWAIHHQLPLDRQ